MPRRLIFFNGGEAAHGFVKAIVGVVVIHQGNLKEAAARMWGAKGRR